MTDLTGLTSISASDITDLRNTLAKSVLGAGEGEETKSFANILSEAIENSENLDESVNVDMLTMLSGETENLSDLLINAQKSELAVNLTVQIRNKAMDAYKEIMNMQV